MPVLMFLLHAWWAIGLVAFALYAGAVAAFLTGWRRVAFVLAAVGTAHVYSGVIFQQGVAECRDAVQREVAAEHERQAAIAQQTIDTLNAKLAIVDQLSAADQDRIAEYESTLAAEAAQPHTPTSPAVAACTLTDRDVRAINGK